MVSAIQLVLVAAVPAVESLRCISGWSGAAREIPPSQINDGYCDCPVDGSDEIETGACSGAAEGGWAGVQVTGTAPSGSGLQCPQQKSLILPQSRIGDGLCDCCDGADEPPSSNCVDLCDEVLAAERAARLKAEADFTEGSRRLAEEGANFARMVKETTVEIDVLKKTDIPQFEEEVNSFDGQIRESKLKYAEARSNAVIQIQSSLGYLGDAVSADEIVSFIIASCQLAGEMVNPDGSGNRSANQKTCIPLRLAGLDGGILWEDESFDEYSASVRYLDGSDENAMEEFATLLDKNSGGDENVSFGKDDSTSHHSRRHGHERRDRHRRHHHDDDDDAHSDYSTDDDDYPYEADDDYPGDYPGHEEEEEGGQELDTENVDEQAATETESQSSGDEPVEKSREEIVKEAVELHAMFASRAAFKSRAKELIEKIDSISNQDDVENEPENDGDEGSDENDAEDESDSPPVDPMAVQMVSGSLSRRLRQLERGADFATSAKILLDALLSGEDAEGKKGELTNLAIGTVHHSKLDAASVAELYYALLPELQSASEDSEGTCSSPHANMCPPQTIARGSTSLPPESIVSAAKALCEERSTSSMSCAGGEGSDEDIPTDVQDGFYGYYAPKPRGDDDSVNDHFLPLTSLNPSRPQTSHLENEKSQRDGGLKEARDRLSGLEHKIGGEDGQKYGPDGELYGLTDSCHKVESGKYEYELCIFGKATQRDKGQKGGGTNLGKWAEMTKDESTGEIVLKWDKGTKCWNGPQRSSTVYVTCGAETKVLTADEPRTCEYEMKMESHIACDEKFRELHGL